MSPTAIILTRLGGSGVATGGASSLCGVSIALFSGVLDVAEQPATAENSMESKTSRQNRGKSLDMSVSQKFPVLQKYVRRVRFLYMKRPCLSTVYTTRIPFHRKNSANIDAAHRSTPAVTAKQLYGARRHNVKHHSATTQNKNPIGAVFFLQRNEASATYTTRLERCPSGRRSTTGNRVYVEAYQEFKSLPLRQNLKGLLQNSSPFFCS